MGWLWMKSNCAWVFIMLPECVMVMPSTYVRRGPDKADVPGTVYPAVSWHSGVINAIMYPSIQVFIAFDFGLANRTLEKRRAQAEAAG